MNESYIESISGRRAFHGFFSLSCCCLIIIDLLEYIESMSGRRAFQGFFFSLTCCCLVITDLLEYVYRSRILLGFVKWRF